MWGHRIAGILVSGFGLALLVGQLVMLYGSESQQKIMVDMGLPGVVVLTALGAVSFSIGSLLATAPHATRRHLRRVTALAKRRPLQRTHINSL